MDQEPATTPVTIRTAKEMVNAIDTLASAMDRSRNYVINQAIQHYLETHAWQIERIKEGLTAAREGRVQSADAVFAKIAAKHGWHD
ncbi:MAG: ribbon-helix-helix protein, CopG family [Rhodospirillaceae bacterium]|nr:ribbon-helix-helix protein, CopG family [Rhodospirillaceae bacterium]